MAACERTFRFLTEGPLKDNFIGIAPAVRREPPTTWCLPNGTRRPVTETKGERTPPPVAVAAVAVSS